jgi:phosphoribosylaminoimidazole carboxylase PurE protein
MACEPFNGLDALLAMVQMPPGIPVATVTSGKSGADNAALLAVSILALSDSSLSAKLKDFRKKQTEKVKAADAELQEALKNGGIPQ